MKLRYALLVTGPAYGTQQALCAYQFALALLRAGHQLDNVFFYREGISNANLLTSPASDEFDLVRAWQALAEEQQFTLSVCVAAGMRRGISSSNLALGFVLSGLGSLAESLLTCDRVIQF